MVCYQMQLLSSLFCFFGALSCLVHSQQDLEQMGNFSVAYKKVQSIYPTLSAGEAKQFAHAVMYGMNEPHSQSSLFEGSNEWDCPDLPPSPSIPTSVHALRPGDIKVVGAVGDSITAGFGALARTILGIFTEYRGVSWSIGGDSTFSERITMPNIIRHYNEETYGFSTGTGGPTSSNARMNVAVSGARFKDLFVQAEDLVRKMIADPNVNEREDWKMITIWIGCNNLCDYCSNEEENSPDRYFNEVLRTLRFLQSSLPRTFVNLVQLLDVSKLYPVATGMCRTYIQCPCAINHDEQVRELVTKASLAYDKKLELIEQDAGLQSKEDFTVVVQPFMTETPLPTNGGKPDMSYFAPDCFHFSGKGHEAASVGLWNNMVEPVGEKSKEWHIGEAIKCPTEDSPFLFTTKNSG